VNFNLFFVQNILAARPRGPSVAMCIKSGFVFLKISFSLLPVIIASLISELVGRGRLLKSFGWTIFTFRFFLSRPFFASIIEVTTPFILPQTSVTIITFFGLFLCLCIFIYFNEKVYS